SDPIEHRPAVSDADTVRRNKPLFVRINERRRMMSQTARSRRRDRLLNGIRTADIQRLRSAHAIDRRIGKRRRLISEVILIVELTMPVDDHKNVAVPGGDRGVASSARPPPRVIHLPKLPKR